MPPHAVVLCLALAAAALPGSARAEGPRGAPLLSIDLIDTSKGTRAPIRCRGREPVLELDAALLPFGGRPLGRAGVATVARREGMVSCVDGAARTAVRLRPITLRAVLPNVVRDAQGARVVLAIEGQALGPRVAPDDDVYLVWRGELVAAARLQPRGAACPEARWNDERVVVCLDAARLAGRGPARVRLQAAGRVEEAAGAPLELSRLLAETGPPR